MIRVHTLINHNTNLSDLWLKIQEHNSFQTCWKLSESKTFNNYLYQLISERKYKFPTM